MTAVYQQEPPFAIQIELTEGCNLWCDFCGLRGIRQGPNKNMRYLTVPRAQILASKIRDEGWTSRIEFAMHGEPTMNPMFQAILASFRVQLPKNSMMLTTNGGGLLGDTPEETVETVRRVLRIVNVVAIDDYQYTNIGRKLREHLAGRISWHEYPAFSDANPHRRRRPHQHDLVFVEDISQASRGTHSRLHNHAGAAAPLDYSKKDVRCEKPFRELSIRWDGNVAICCEDWRGTFKVGNAIEKPLGVLWNSPALNAARKKLYHKERDFGPCHGCDHVGHRLGLLPDKKGQVELEEPSYEDESLIENACEGDPYAPVVERPWEV